MKQVICILVFVCFFVEGHSQPNEHLSISDSTFIHRKEIRFALDEMQHERKQIKSLVFPSIMLAYGFVALESEELHEMDYSIKEEIHEDHPGIRTNIDNFSQYAPAFAVYALNAFGVKGKNNFRDRTMIYLLANMMAGTAVQSLKAGTRATRPNGGSSSFPSGHTTTAFVSAEFLRQEYKDVSPWYGIAGYVVATGTGLLRISNNAHWFRDVIPGAGLGMLSTRIAYWIYPSIEKKIFHKRNAIAVVMPTYEEHAIGVSMGYAIGF